MPRERNYSFALRSRRIEIFYAADRDPRIGSKPAYLMKMRILGHDAAEIVPHLIQNRGDPRAVFSRKGQTQIALRAAGEKSPSKNFPANPTANGRSAIDVEQTE